MPIQERTHWQGCWLEHPDCALSIITDIHDMIHEEVPLPTFGRDGKSAHACTCRVLEAIVDLTGSPLGGDINGSPE